MKRLLLLLITLSLFNSCHEKEIDRSLIVRRVNLQVSVSNAEYQLSWEPAFYICITDPCPGYADLEAERYEIQIANEEIGTFRTYRIVDAATTSISIPVSSQGKQLVTRILSLAKGALAVNSNIVMTTTDIVSKSAPYSGFGSDFEKIAGDVTVDGKKATYSMVVEEKPGQYATSLYLSNLQDEKPVSSKLLTLNGKAAAFSADGQQVAYFSAPENGLVIYDITSGSKRTLAVPNANEIQGIAWSPDGKWLAFSTDNTKGTTLWKIATAGGTPIQLVAPTPLPGLNNIQLAGIDWSPDGQFIAVSRVRGTGSDEQYRGTISLYSPEGGGELRFFDIQPNWIDSHASFSPDGKQLAFLSFRTGRNNSLWIRDVATGKVRQVKLSPELNPSDEYIPRWLGNDRLVFLANNAGGKGYFTVLLQE
jgi:WD40 repeat protein